MEEKKERLSILFLVSTILFLNVFGIIYTAYPELFDERQMQITSVVILFIGFIVFLILMK